jgi:hypothetical protein
MFDKGMDSNLALFFWPIPIGSPKQPLEVLATKGYRERCRSHMNPGNGTETSLAIADQANTFQVALT